jgi:hypothetical protein
MRSTELTKGTNRGNPELNGQWNKFTFYCPECHAHTSGGRHTGKSPHRKGCTGAFTKISSTARIPRANASKRQWKLFNEKFVQRLIPIASIVTLPPPVFKDLRYKLK